MKSDIDKNITLEQIRALAKVPQQPMPPMDSRATTCKKVGHPTKYIAHRQSVHLNKTQRANTTVYLCNICSKWHVGTVLKPRRARMKTVRRG
ncbi:MAG: hypothetical protein FWC73_14215 [Defluviitaleaceae bacterium]|nr:hypothetical protein [Defluviitaleaceae bacterium]